MSVMTAERQDHAAPALAPAAIKRPASGIAIDPAKLIWWRESRGWSRQRLSREIARLRLADDETGGLITVSRDAIAKNENGERKPKSSTVQAYCAALSTPEHPCLPRDLLPGGKALDPHEAAEARRARLRHNRQLRRFAVAHGVQYKNPVSGRVYYSRPLRTAYELSVSGASSDQLAAAIAAAVAATVPAEAGEEAPQRLGLGEHDSIGELDLAVRTHNALVRGELPYGREPQSLTVIGDLTSRTADELRDVRDIGGAALAEIREKLAAAGFALKGEEPGRAPEQLAS